MHSNISHIMGRFEQDHIATVHKDAVAIITDIEAFASRTATNKLWGAFPSNHQCLAVGLVAYEVSGEVMALSTEFKFTYQVFATDDPANDVKSLAHRFKVEDLQVVVVMVRNQQPQEVYFFDPITREKLSSVNAARRIDSKFKH